MTSKTALVTGASRGIGRAIAVRLAEMGFRVGAHYQSNHAAAQKTLSEMPGDSHILLPYDLGDPNSVPLLADTALNHFDGRIDVFIHNAGVYLPSPILSTESISDWRSAVQSQMQINFWAGAELSYLLAKPMAESGWGRIIHISSRAGLRGEARHCGYGASKAAQINFVRSLAMELAPQGVGCFAVAPGWTNTDMATDALARRGDQIRAAIPAGRVASPDDIAQLVAFLVTPAADYLTGNTIDVNGASYLH